MHIKQRKSFRMFVAPLQHVNLRHKSDADDANDRSTLAVSVAMLMLLLLVLTANAWMTNAFAHRVLKCSSGYMYAFSLASIIFMWVPLNPTMSRLGWFIVALGVFTDWLGSC